MIEEVFMSKKANTSAILDFQKKNNLVNMIKSPRRLKTNNLRFRSP